MGTTTVEELSIEISAKSKKADNAIDSLVERLDRLEKGLLGLSSAQNKTNKGFDATNQKIVQTNKTITSITKTTKGSQNAFALLANNFRSIIGVATSLGISLATLDKAFEKLKASTMDYSELMESINFQNVALDKISEQWKHQYQIYGYESAEEYAASFKERLSQTLGNLTGMTFDIETGLILSTGRASLGANMQGVVQFQAQLLSLTNSLGLTGEASYQTANAFSYLAADIASLNGLNFDNVAQKLRSGLLGSSEVLYNLGIDATDAALQVTALRHGIEKSVSSMSQAEKTQLRFLTVLESSTVAFGDQARTINSLSNMMKLFEGTTADISVLIGQIFAPVLLKTLPIINGFAIALKDLLSNIARALNIDTGNASTSFEGLGDTIGLFTDEMTSADKATQKLKKSLLGFDKLNVISTASGSAGTALNGYTGIDLTEQIMQASENYTKIAEDAYNNMVSYAQNAADKINKIIGFAGKGFSDAFVADVGLINNSLLSISQTAEEIGSGTSNNLSVFQEKIANLFGANSGMQASVMASLAGGTLGGTAAALDSKKNFIVDSANDTLNSLSSISDETISLFNGFSQIATTFESDGFQRIIDLFNQFNLVMTFGSLKIVSELLEGIWKNFAQPFSANSSKIKDAFDSIFKIVANLLSPLSLVTDKLQIKFSSDSLFSVFMQQLADGTTINFGRLLDTLNELLDFIEAITAVIPVTIEYLKQLDGINFDFLNLGKFMTGTLPMIGVQPFAVGAVPQFATGGFPKEDGLFYANHTELVGKFSNGKTAVANNEQITEGIRLAAYMGVKQAMAESGGSANVTFQVEGDPHGLFRVVRKEADYYLKRTGSPAF